MDAIQQQIKMKLDYNYPYYASTDVVQAIPTEMDRFPYDRFFRGVYNAPNPRVFDRKAGYRPLGNDGEASPAPKSVQPEYCWSYPCSTVFPCVNGFGFSCSENTSCTANQR